MYTQTHTHPLSLSLSLSLKREKERKGKWATVMGKLKNYDCHKQKYYVPQNKPAWSLLNLKQASKKIEKEKSSAKKQVLGKKKKIQQKLANRKGGQGVRNPANPDFKKNLEKVREGEREETSSSLGLLTPSRRFPPPPPRETSILTYDMQKPDLEEGEAPKQQKTRL